LTAIDRLAFSRASGAPPGHSRASRFRAARPVPSPSASANAHAPSAWHSLLLLPVDRCVPGRCERKPPLSSHRTRTRVLDERTNSMEYALDEDAVVAFAEKVARTRRSCSAPRLPTPVVHDEDTAASVALPVGHESLRRGGNEDDHRPRGGRGRRIGTIVPARRARHADPTTPPRSRGFDRRPRQGPTSANCRDSDQPPAFWICRSTSWS
jgi:hypothetical protein